VRLFRRDELAGQRPLQGQVVRDSLGEPEQAAASRTKMERSVDRVARLFIPGVMALLTASDAFPEHLSAGHLAELVRSKVVVLTGIVLLIYLPLEWVLGAWSQTFLMGLGMGERSSVFTLSGFWLSFLASRFVTALLMASGWIAVVAIDLANVPTLLVSLSLMMAGISARRSSAISRLRTW
jgi:hypothetical protein